MKKILTAMALALASLFCSGAFAQDMMGQDQLYKTFGEKPGLTRLMDDLMTRLVADERTRPFFEKANQQRIKEQLVDQFCQLGGGPCVYKGADMKSAHGSLDINKAQFNALVEVLQQAMDAQGIPFSAQNQMLAKLAPMNRDVITVR
jgi:hemoglobin